jgi:hypothetical protein
MASWADIFSIAKDLVLTLTNVILALVAYRQARIIADQAQTAKQTLYAQNQIGVSAHLLRHVAFDQLWLVMTNSGPASALGVNCNAKSQKGNMQTGFAVGPLGVGEEKNFALGQFSNLHPAVIEVGWTAINPLGQSLDGHIWLPTAEAKTTTEHIS